jgi:undecaprenyl-diphosphatase
MADAVLWGLVQGLTEFLPISSSGHLVLVPEILGREGPSLATSAVLHLGTLLAILVYFRREVREIVRFSPEGRNLARWLVIGTIPAAVLGLLLREPLEEFNETPRAVAVALFLTGVALLATGTIASGRRRVQDSSNLDALLIGIGQALALIPGVSRSGATIGAGLGRRFDRAEAARYAFLLGIPAIAGAGLLEFVDLAGSEAGIPGETWIGLAVAAVSGYAAIALLLGLIRRAGLVPFGAYCVVAGAVAFFVV